MSPCWIVIALFVVLRLTGAVHLTTVDTWTEAVRLATGITFVIMGTAHLTPLGRDVRRLVPPQIRWPAGVVVLLGLWQIAGGIGLVSHGMRRAAAAALLVLLFLKLPANIRAARASLRLPGRYSTAPAWRVPAQLLWIALVWWAGS